ncbi:hypothetical protein [Lacrimispora defluvii]|uniref:DUF5050 domain-containing protein n=1 Tax=Lacrimispora defluvii TaxID=2719233 RepID=A0ABX1VPZ0_9FIRM|nr:hypothetical protein [Lacrimispora defluvii]NNJ30508.1 hypothetical protein [Lacrimispora defluvii]
MNKKTKGLILPLVMICIIFLSGCHIQQDQGKTSESSSNKVQAYNVTFDDSALRTYIEIYESKLLYMEMSESDATFYIYNFKDGSNQKILTVDDFALKGISNALINDTLYFYLSLYNGSELENDLYAVNFSVDKMYAVSKNMYSQKLIPLTVLGGSLVSLQGNNTDNGAFNSFVETMDSNQNMEQVELDSKAGTPVSGKANAPRQIIYITSDGSCLYALEKSKSPSGFNCFITRFNSDFAFIGQTDITDLLKTYEITSGIGSFSVFSHYFTITDYSNNTIVGDFDKGDNQALLYENDVEYVRDFSGLTANKYFYKRNTNQIYRMDEGTGKIELQNFDLKNDSSNIRVMLSYGDNLLIVKQPDSEHDGRETVYLIPQNNNKL